MSVYVNFEFFVVYVGGVFCHIMLMCRTIYAYVVDVWVCQGSCISFVICLDMSFKCLFYVVIALCCRISRYACLSLICIYYYDM